MADTSTTGDRKRRSVIESEFFSNVEQLEWLERQNALPNEKLLEILKSTHKNLFHNVFIVPKTSEKGEENNRRCNEAIEDIATILESRGALPPEFGGYVLNPQELPWKPKHPILPAQRYLEEEANDRELNYENTG